MRDSQRHRELLTDDHGNVDAILRSRAARPIGVRLVDGTHANAVVVDPATGERIVLPRRKPGRTGAR